MNNTEWQTIHYYQSCIEAAERCGFTIEQGRESRTQIMCSNHPYAKDTVIKVIDGFYPTKMWLEGYEQRIFEVKNI